LIFNYKIFNNSSFPVKELSHHRSGLATNALLLMFNYAINILNVTKFTAKISTKNQPSIQLFTKKFEFVEISFSEIFQEHSLELIINEEIKEKIKNAVKGKYFERLYDEM
jgi:hypothetical protein